MSEAHPPEHRLAYPNVIDGAEVDGARPLVADAVVVGTGAGGAVAARRLRDAGLDVLMIEEGTLERTETFVTDPATTAFCALALMRAGSTPVSGAHRDAVRKALAYVVRAVEESGEQLEVDATHQGCLPLGEGMERAVRQLDPVVAAAWFVAGASQRVQERHASGAQLGAALLPVVPGLSMRGRVRPRGVLSDRVGQDLGDDAVLPGRQRHRELARHRLVDLRRPAPPAGQVGWRLVAGTEQAGLDQLVEVEGGQAARHTDRLGRLLAGDRVGGALDVLVQRAPAAVGQRRHGVPLVDHARQIITNIAC